MSLNAHRELVLHIPVRLWNQDLCAVSTDDSNEVACALAGYGAYRRMRHSCWYIVGLSQLL